MLKQKLDNLPQSYVTAVLFAAAATVARLVLWESLGNSAPYSTFYPAVIFSALIGGLRAGLLATALSAVSADYFLLEPAGFGITRLVDWVGMLVFTISGVLISFVTDSMHQARSRAQAAEEAVRLAAERKRMDQAFHESELRFRELFENALEAIIIFEHDVVIAINDAACNMFGYERNVCENLLKSDIVAKHDRRDNQDIGCADRKVCYLGIMKFLRKDGSDFDGEVSSFAMPGKGSRSGMFIRDVSERKELEKKKANFLAMVSHDFKSPLTTIIGYSELMAENLQADAQCGRREVEMAEGIRSAAFRLLSLAEDFLAISSLEGGKTQISKALVELPMMLEEMKAAYTPMAVKKDITLVLDTGDVQTAVVDGKYLERAIANLLQNAINYTQAGGKVVVKASNGHSRMSKRRVDGDGFITISVQDTGPGIPEDEKARIFDAYYRSSKPSGVKGTGLGLSIVKQVAEAHGGRVEVKSEVGRGSTFSLFIPNIADTGEFKKAA